MTRAAGRLAGRVAIVTGGNRGIGRGIADLFAREGARLVIVGRDRQSGDEAVARIAQAGGEAMFVAGDVALAARRPRWLRPRSNASAGSTSSATMPGSFPRCGSTT
ncbi:MAG: SDR family NAD(P)-dependent oxidoreductase [Dongiaceae bacterium]